MSAALNGGAAEGRLRLILLLIAALAVAVPAWVVTHAPPIARARAKVLNKLPRARGVPATVVPEVEPVEFVQLSPEDAKAYNDSVPFSTAPNPAARPFHIAGDADSVARATDCMAAAVLYEAGDDPEGQRAVAQVVVNRLRHPAFPKTVCGVVFEGQERSTGCQFSFTCDGAMTRWKPSAPMWERARAVATQALKGRVFRPVGYSTHYHTDWVVPYWQASLDKVAAVHTHLFFRWAGWWGTPPAFDRTVSSDEPVIAQLAPISPAHGLAQALDAATDAMAAASAFVGDAAVPGAPAPPLAGGTAPHPIASDPDVFFVVIDPRAPDILPALAQRACGDRAYCKLFGWLDARLVPDSMTMSPGQYAAMGFSYLRDRANGFDRALWNCGQFKRADGAQCMRARGTLSAVPVAASPAPAPTAVKGPAPLTGVRRETVPQPAPSPTPAGKAAGPAE